MSDWSEEKCIAFDEDNFMSWHIWSMASLRFINGNSFPEIIYNEILNHQGEIRWKGKCDHHMSYEKWMKKTQGNGDYDRKIYTQILGWRNIYEKY